MRPLKCIFFIFLILNSFMAYAMDYLKIPESPTMIEGAPFWFKFSNDAMGFEHPGYEWDDGASYGFEIGSAALPFDLSSAISYTGYTNRGVSSAEVYRYDVLDYALAWKGGDWYPSGFHLSLIPALGISFYGDMGGLIVQESWHKLVSVTRPIPLENSYIDQGEISIYGFTSFKFNIRHTNVPFLSLSTGLSYDTGQALYYNISLPIAVRTVFKTQSLELGYLYSREGESPYSQNLPHSDAYGQLTLRSGMLFLEKKHLWKNSQMSGAIGIDLIPGQKLLNERPSIRERLDIGSGLSQQSNLARWSWGVGENEDSPLWTFVSYQSGWGDKESKAKTIARRFYQIDSGFEYHFVKKYRAMIDPYGQISLAYREDWTQSATVFNSSLIDSDRSLGMVFQGGLRINPGSREHKIESPFQYFFSIEGGAQFKKSLINSSFNWSYPMTFVFGCQLN